MSDDGALASAPNDPAMDEVVLEDDVHIEPEADQLWGDSDATNKTTSNKKQKEKRHISLLSAYMLLTTWSTSSSNVLYPFTFGVLGVVGGPIFMILAFLISWQTTRWTVQAARAVHAETFGALGESLGGRWGRVLFEGSQILFQQLFLPVAVIICSQAVQSLTADASNFTDCNGNVALLFAVVSFVLIQVSRELENITGIAYVSCAAMLIMTIALAVEVSTKPPPGWLSANSSAVVPSVSEMSPASGRNDSWELFVGMGHHTERYHWSSIFSALGIFVYSCLPSCIAVETMAELLPSDRLKMERIVDASFVSYVVIYLIAGIPAVLHWGGDLPLPIELENSPSGYIVKVVLILGTLLDFVLASTTVNRWVLRMWKVNFAYGVWSRKNALLWLQYSWPSSVLAIVMALCIPRLSSLTGLLDSIAGSTLQITAVPLLLCLTANTDVLVLGVSQRTNGVCAATGPG
eukprot:INCI542.1.p1 GENE.INCI542.1~~INCI542.1.p1  ORF type:complete len:463 (+),score=53.71 INCI542.1:237-1625(+)